MIRRGARPMTVCLCPELIDYGQEVDVRLNGSRIHSGFLTPQVGPLFDDLRQRADRTMTFTTEIRS